MDDQWIMLEGFTARARRVALLAEQEARMRDHSYVGTEHILLGLTRVGEVQSRRRWSWPVRVGWKQVESRTAPVAAKALENLGVSLETARQQAEEIIGRGQQAPSGHIPFTPQAKNVLELASREARQLGHARTGTGHLLLGLIREGEGVAAEVLVNLGAGPDRIREQVIKLLSGNAGTEGAATAAEEEELIVEEIVELHGEEVAARTSVVGGQVDEINTLLHDIIQRLERIKRHIGQDNPP
jgi:ATP-dependent Clp protease ATP-binding subunit ClpC